MRAAEVSLATQAAEVSPVTQALAHLEHEPARWVEHEYEDRFAIHSSAMEEWSDRDSSIRD